MSAWGKFLAPVTASSWTFAWNDGSPQSVNITDGTYDTVYHLANNLNTKIKDVDASNYVYFAELYSNRCRIYLNNAASITWASCTDALTSALGFDETETIQSPGSYIWASSQPEYAWFPGVISRGAALGEGLQDDSGWQPTDLISRKEAGSGVVRKIGPARQRYERRLRFGSVKRTELFNKTKGVVCLSDRWVYDTLRWYPDRDDISIVTGTLSEGTQMDPGYNNYETDDDHEYWIVSLANNPVFNRTPSHPDWFSVDLVFTADPK